MDSELFEISEELALTIYGIPMRLCAFSVIKKRDMLE